MSPEIERILQQTLDRIENALQTDITPEELSRAAGFSHYHFCRIFKAATGLSVMRYITLRRLAHALYSISCGQEKTEAALAYGFDSYAGFYKAFRRAYGASPTEHLRSHRAAFPARVNLKERGENMEKHIIEQALAHWGLEGAAAQAVRYPNTGNLSGNTFSVAEGYVLKASRGLGSMQRQAALQKVLHAHGLAAQVVPTLDGRDTARMEDWECLLMERLPGEALRAEQLLREPAMGRMVGEGLARLHTALKECDPLLCSRECFADTLRGWALPKLREAEGDRWQWAETWLEGFAALEKELPVQIIHRDPNPDNLLAAEGSITGFLDFELSCIAPRIFDLAYAATGVLSVAFGQAGDGEAFAELARAIWSGYDAASPLAPEERRALPDMVIAIQLICVAAFTGTDRFARLAATNRQMLELILANEEKLRRPFA